MFDYPVTLTPNDGTVLVTFVDVPEAITFGANEAEALALAVDALETGLLFYVDARTLSFDIVKSDRIESLTCSFQHGY